MSTAVLSPQVEEFLLKFEAMAPAADWMLTRTGCIRTTDNLCPVEFMAGSGKGRLMDALSDVFGPANDAGPEGWSRGFTGAADNLEGGLYTAVRRSLLAACGLSE